MKTLTTISLFLVLSFNLFGQNWQLFPYNQRSFYEINNGKETPFVETLMNDSIDGNTFLMNARQYNNPAIDVDLSNSLYTYNSSYRYPNESLIDKVFDIYSFSLTGNATVLTNHNNNIYSDFYGIIFYQFANVNDRWNVSGSSLYFNCDSTSAISVFDETDSVKYFSVNKETPDPYLSKLKFILSKNHGLIEFAPFNQLMFNKPVDVAKVRLIGYENGGQKKGRVTPQFGELFHLTTGDELEWYYYYEKYSFAGQPPTIEKFYYTEKILDVSYTDEGIRYQVNRSKEVDWNTFDGYLNFNFDDYQPLLATNTGNASFSRAVPYFEYVLGFKDWSSPTWFIDKIILNDSVSSISFESPGSGITFADCHLVYTEIFFGFTLDSRFGVSKYWVEDGATRTLIGATIAGKHYKLSDPAASISKIKLSEVKIYPNPFYDRLYVNTNTNEIYSYKLIDLAGNVLLSGKLEGNSLDFGDLKSGIYTLLLTDKEKISLKRIVKM